ncbi:MAG TPA: LysR family transcriptional regulator [Kofleriaceae bacterium]|nr:LysR family transcriptional regulator [Kofleriaceae bacterium]
MLDAEPVETSELIAFAKTVDARSLSRAAAELGLPRATVSRRLARLEQRLGARLLRRTTRSLALTDAGEALYRHARIVLDAVDDAVASVRRTDDKVRGDLRISVPPHLPPSFYAMVCDFAERYPDVRVQVHATSRHVDLARDGYDVALRAGTHFEPGLIARKLADERVLAVASPAYVAQHGAPANRRELARHRLLMGFSKAELPQTHWLVGADTTQQLDGVLFSNDLHLLVYAALRGQGIAMLPLTMTRAFLEERTLVAILPGVLEHAGQVAVVYAEREFIPPQVRAFVDAVVAWAPGELGAVSAKCAKMISRRASRRAPRRART